ncbi:unnamed protein product [Rotaria sp. Silwood2]|nr:unnamed protein product [Rotaria sp. Silwood2]CAF3370570.1 unnamed protein product [Rotaria sp. Silwood2]CAF4120127.1 unnamed protein product [Rotaria sp. Silwood2]CAF4172290.1 unnamed protein product [Rotaria sp. Silwood2]
MQIERLERHKIFLSTLRSKNTIEIAIKQAELDKNEATLTNLKYELQERNDLKNQNIHEHQRLLNQFSPTANKEHDVVDAQNHLLLSLNVLEEQIQQTTQDLYKNEELLHMKDSYHKQCQVKMEKTREEIQSNQEHIEELKKKTEEIHQRKQTLLFEKDTLEKKSQQLNETVSVLTTILKEKSENHICSPQQTDDNQAAVKYIELELEDVRQNIRTIEELKYDDELCNAQRQLNQYNLERKNQEIEEHQLEKTLESFEEIHKNKTNQLAHYQQNLNVVEESLCQIQTTIKSFEANQIQLCNDVEHLENQQDELLSKLTDLTVESDNLRELKEEAIQKWRYTGSEYVAAQHQWLQRKRDKYQHKNRWKDATVKERRLRIELDQCIQEKRLTEIYEQQCYHEVETKSSGSMVLSDVPLAASLAPMGVFSLIGARITAAYATENPSLFQKSNLQMNYRQNIAEVDYKRLKLMDKLETARFRSTDFGEKYSQIVTAFIQDEEEVQRKSVFCMESRATAEKYIKEHRDVCACTNEVEHKLRMINDKLQQTQEQIKNTKNDIHLYKELRKMKTSQIDALKETMKDLNELIENQSQSIKELRDVIQQKQATLSNTIQYIDKHISIVKKLEGMN